MAAKPRPPLRAYVVQGEYEGSGGVYYARHAIVARRAGANEHNGGEIQGTTCKRAPWADAYAPGPCPKLVLIAQGWWFECCGCNGEIRDDAESGDERSVSPRKAVEVGDLLYCSPLCRRRALAEKTRRDVLKLRAIQQLRDRLWKVVPGVTLVGDHAYVNTVDGRLRAIEVRLDFKFPGSKHGPAHYRLDRGKTEPELTVPYGDLAAWDAWRESQKKRKAA